MAVALTGQTSNTGQSEFLSRCVSLNFLFSMASIINKITYSRVRTCFLFYMLSFNNTEIYKGFDGQSKDIQIVLPQMSTVKKDCGLASTGVFGSFSRGSYSEGFALFARSAASAVRVSSFSDSRPGKVILCSDLMPRAGSYVCFQRIVGVASADGRGLSHYLIRPPRHGVYGAQFSHAALRILGMPQFSQTMKGSDLVVTLMTRKTGPRWINEKFVVESLQSLLEKRNALRGGADRKYVLRYAGDAELIGVRDGCVHARDQVSLWRDSWLVIAPHGAHESNVVFMHQESEGLVEAFACGHRSGTFKRLATAAGVKYRAAREKSSSRRSNCEKDLGRTYLDEPRVIDFDHDTLLSVVEDALR